jgi:hypothetical protein
MGEPNNALTAYMNRPDRIQSVLEYYLGQNLAQDWECEEIRGFYTIQNSKGKLSFRQRDNLGKACLAGFRFLLGLENQDSVNLTYPFRLLEIDSPAYGKAIEDIQEKNQRCKVIYDKEDDFKYYYRKEDQIIPILNLTLYWGKGNWNRPLCLRDMMEDLSPLPQKLQDLAGDYKVHLICMRFIPNEKLAEMDSDLKYVLGIMKHTGSRKRYENYILENSDFFKRVPKSAVDVIDACTNIKDIRKSLEFVLNPAIGKKEADVCKALKDIKKHAKRQGIKLGLAQGMEQGLEQGIVQGLEQGTLRINKLNQLLLAQGRQEDLLRSITVPVFQKKLFGEYQI